MAIYKPNKVEADNIKKIRTKNDLSQEEFAVEINKEIAKHGPHPAVKARTVQNYESGLYSIPLAVRVAIRNRFGIEIKDAPKQTPMREVFRRRLRRARKASGMTSSDIARISGCPQYKFYEEGKYIPKLEHFASISRTLGVCPDYLLGLEEEAERYTAIPQQGVDLRAKFPARLKKARKKRRLPAHSAAKLAGCPEFTKYEKGERLPSLETLYKICKNLGISSSSLLGAEEEAGEIEM